MGVFKDAVYQTALNSIRKWPRGKCHLSNLLERQSGCPALVKAWEELQANRAQERLKKASGFKQVLLERPDLFEIVPNHAGIPIVSLTRAAQSLCLADAAVEDLGAGGYLAQGSAELLAAELLADGGGAAADELIAAELPAADASGAAADAPAQDTAGVETPPPAKRPKVAPAKAAPSQVKPAQVARSAAQDKAPARGKAGAFSDIVWTPALGARRRAQIASQSAMARALFEAVENQPPGVHAKIPVLGQDFKVARLKKEPQFQKERLQDILAFFPDVFELLPEGSVKLQPGAEAALPDADERLEEEIDENTVLLPTRIDEPQSTRDKMQALRIELLHSLHRRGGRASMQDLGQEPRLQYFRQNISQAKSLAEFALLFPENFSSTLVDGVKALEAIATEVEDMSMIDASIARNNIAWAAGKTWAPWPNQPQPRVTLASHVPRLVPRPAVPMG